MSDSAESSQHDREDGQETGDEELDETQKAVAAGFGTAVGLMAFVTIGLAVGMPDMVVF